MEDDNTLSKSEQNNLSLSWFRYSGERCAMAAQDRRVDAIRGLFYERIKGLEGLFLLSFFLHDGLKNPILLDSQYYVWVVCLIRRLGENDSTTPPNAPVPALGLSQESIWTSYATLVVVPRQATVAVIMGGCSMELINFSLKYLEVADVQHYRRLLAQHTSHSALTTFPSSPAASPGSPTYSPNWGMSIATSSRGGQTKRTTADANDRRPGDETTPIEVQCRRSSRPVLIHYHCSSVLLLPVPSIGSVGAPLHQTPFAWGCAAICHLIRVLIEPSAGNVILLALEPLATLAPSCELLPRSSASSLPKRVTFPDGGVVPFNPMPGQQYARLCKSIHDGTI
ncbi:hypothetical protein BKA70DRAFT_1467465 [Coprinopsis sp. MPI-PUGE-AT-0042]|nr:hypothetical protein BKA70DRAFT_1467465 [Coprinopsis sp. MPI-PUGE-AT-0042]